MAEYPWREVPDSGVALPSSSPISPSSSQKTTPLPTPMHPAERKALERGDSYPYDPNNYGGRKELGWKPSATAG
jgi:hypothetical protein